MEAPRGDPHSPLPKFTALSKEANLLWEEKDSFKLGRGEQGGRGGLLGCSLKTPLAHNTPFVLGWWEGVGGRMKEGGY